MLKRIFLLATLLFACTGVAYAQDISYTLTPPAPGATLRVCTYPAAQNPCTSLASIFNDAAGTSPVANPIALQPTGVITFYAASGQYVIQLSGTVSKVFAISLGGGGGTGTPGGTNTQVQFNDSGAFGGAVGWTWSKTLQIMALARGSSDTPQGQFNVMGTGAAGNCIAVFEPCLNYFSTPTAPTDGGGPAFFVMTTGMSPAVGVGKKAAGYIAQFDNGDTTYGSVGDDNAISTCGADLEMNAQAGLVALANCWLEQDSPPKAINAQLSLGTDIFLNNSIPGSVSLISSPYNHATFSLGMADLNAGVIHSTIVVDDGNGNMALTPASGGIVEVAHNLVVDDLSVSSPVCTSAGNVITTICAPAFTPSIQNITPVDYAVDTGSANAYVVAPSPVATSYIVGLTVVFKAANANTAASTINVSTLGAKNITKLGTNALLPGDVLAGAVYTAVYDGTEFVLQNPVIGPTPAVVSRVVSGTTDTLTLTVGNQLGTKTIYTSSSAVAVTLTAPVSNGQYATLNFNGTGTVTITPGAGQCRVGAGTLASTCVVVGPNLVGYLVSYDGTNVELDLSSSAFTVAAGTIAVLDQTSQSSTSTAVALKNLAGGAFTIPTTGRYTFHRYVFESAGCPTVGLGSLSMTISWTDPTNARDTTGFSEILVPGVTPTGVAQFQTDVLGLWLVAGSSVTITNTYTPCTTGTWTFENHDWLTAN